MNARNPLKDSEHFRTETLRIGGERIARDRTLDIINPYSRERVGTVPLATLDDVRKAYRIASAYQATLTRYERSSILQKASALLRARADEASTLITLESGLCKKD
jgi:acyl-CoA reductase-like NAD-dependent aldehyde dehydrogenase